MTEMMNETNTAREFSLDIVSAESEIFKGKARRVVASGQLGELEVSHGHAPLLTGLLPGPVHYVSEDGTDEVIYVSGGILEVQPNAVTVLADTVVRARDFNQAEAIRAKQHAEKLLKDKQSDIDYAKTRAELARAAGLLRAIHEMQKSSGSNH